MTGSTRRRSVSPRWVAFGDCFLPLLVGLGVVAVILLVGGAEPQTVLRLVGWGLGAGGAVAVVRIADIGKVAKR